MNLFLKRLYNSSGTPILLKDHLLNLSLNIISRMVFGKKYTEGTGEDDIVTPKEFKEMLDEGFLLNGVLDIGDSIPWLRFLDLQGYIKRMKAVGKKFDRFLEHVLDEHNARRKGVKDYVGKDMVDVLLQLAEDPNLDVKLERHGVKAFSQDLIARGTESSATTIEWGISELLKKPEIFAKAAEELDRVIGRDRWVEEVDMDNPNEFCPERFIGKTIDVKGHDFELIPFGAGRRMCPGYPLGIKVIQASLANLIHGFTWKLPGKMIKEDLNMEEIYGLSTPKKYPLEAVVEPRLPLHMYSVL
ncbi:hypothetical protein PTKIN_Ptkin13bG0100500 [Pterospermum kingtungense]